MIACILGNHVRAVRNAFLVGVLAAPATVHAQDSTAYDQAFTAFADVCINAAPSFETTPSAGQAFGINTFTFAPTTTVSDEYGWYYGYSFPVDPSFVGTQRPGPGELAVSYATMVFQIDRICVVTYYTDQFDPQMQATFYKNVQAKMGRAGQEQSSLNVLSYEVGGFDYEFSISTSGSAGFLTLQLWD